MADSDTRGPEDTTPRESVEPTDTPAAEPTDEAQTAQEPRPRRGRRKFVFVAVLVVLFVAIALPAFSVLQPRYYERYPDLGERMQNWRTSTHALVGCDECHVEPGFVGHATFAVESIGPFYDQLVSGASSTNLLGPPSTEACRRCHTSYREVSSSGDLLIPHEAHVDILDLECAYCHQDLVHTGSPEGRNTPTMEF